MSGLGTTDIHRSGLRLRCRLRRGEHPAAGGGLWGTRREVPSFLYAMPLAGARVFLEETCLVAKPAPPFSVLKRRLHRRLAAMGLKARAREKRLPMGKCHLGEAKLDAHRNALPLSVCNPVSVPQNLGEVS